MHNIWYSSAQPYRTVNININTYIYIPPPFILEMYSLIDTHEGTGRAPGSPGAHLEAIGVSKDTERGAHNLR